MFSNESEKNYKSVNICSYINKKPIKMIKLLYPTRFGIINSEGLGQVDFVDFGPGTVIEVLGYIYEDICDLDGEDMYNTVVKINGYYYYHVGSSDYYDNNSDVTN